MRNFTPESCHHQTYTCILLCDKFTHSYRADINNLDAFRRHFMCPITHDSHIRSKHEAGPCCTVCLIPPPLSPAAPAPPVTFLGESIIATCHSQVNSPLSLCSGEQKPCFHCQVLARCVWQLTRVRRHKHVTFSLRGFCCLQPQTVV